MSVCFGAFVAEIRIQRRVWLRSELNNMRRFYCFLAKVLRQHLQVDLTQSVVIECSNNTAYVSHLNFSHFIEQSFEHFVRARAVRPTCASPLRSTKSLTISHARALSHVFGCFFFFPNCRLSGVRRRYSRRTSQRIPRSAFRRTFRNRTVHVCVYCGRRSSVRRFIHRLVCVRVRFLGAVRIYPGIAAKVHATYFVVSCMSCFSTNIDGQKNDATGCAESAARVARSLRSASHAELRLVGFRSCT
jgi:hypothetical protein